MENRSFGGAASGTEINLINFFTRSLTICRLISTLFAVVVFGCISDQGYIEPYGQCVFNKNQEACHYGVGVGVIAFLSCLLFLALDFKFESISNTSIRRLIVFGDLGFSSFLSFLWFVGFCFLVDQWRKSNLQTAKPTNNARAAIAFSFFSIFTWVALSLMAYKRYSQGDGFSSNPVSSSNQYVGGGGYKQSPYASFPHPGEDDSLGYQQQPFGIPEQPFGVPPPKQNVKTEYNVPEY
ncbi:synaptogyrin-2 [Hydra vulgaris]|uniref:Synaptogyrin-2 n=1 Tax=Hydra vulgaris TaxID=6087 RepID=A0ABM4CDR6_HYDVU